MNKDSEGYNEFVRRNEFRPNSDYQEVWNNAIEACLKIWDDIGPNETDEDIANRFKALKI
jgi:hypothetical protein